MLQYLLLINLSPSLPKALRKIRKESSRLKVFTKLTAEKWKRKIIEANENYHKQTVKIKEASREEVSQ